MGDNGRSNQNTNASSDLVDTPVALVVEDDSDQRDLIGAILEESEVQVIECESAEAAMTVMEKVGDRTVFVLADVELAGVMDGVELARAVDDRWPHARVVTTSGGCDNTSQADETHAETVARARSDHRAGARHRCAASRLTLRSGGAPYPERVRYRFLCRFFP